MKMKPTKTRGSSLSEYGLLAGLVAVAAISAVVMTGDEVRSSFDSAARTLSDGIETKGGTPIADGGESTPETPVVPVPTDTERCEAYGFSNLDMLTAGDDTHTAAKESGKAVCGLEGNDTITLRDTPQTVLMGKGDDVVTGAQGAHTYIYFMGDGNDSIYDVAVIADGDTLVMPDITPEDFTLSQTGSNGDLLVTFTNGQVLTLRNALNSNLKYTIESWVMDGETWTAQDVRDRLVDDIKKSGATEIYANDLSHNYTHTVAQDGSYMIRDSGAYKNDPDSLVFTDIASGDVTMINNGGNLEISTPDGDVVSLYRFDYNSVYNEIETISFLGDMVTMTNQEYRDRANSDAKATGYVNGSYRPDNYYHANGDGSYTISEYSNYSSWKPYDLLEFTDLASTDVVVSKPGSNLVIETPAGDVIQVNRFDDGDSDYQIDTYRFTDGDFNSNQMASFAANTGIAAGGTVNTSGYGETMYYRLANGSVNIEEYSVHSGQVDQMIFPDIDIADVTFQQCGCTLKHLRLLMPDGDAIWISKQAYTSGNAIDEFIFQGGTPTTVTRADINAAYSSYPNY